MIHLRDMLRGGYHWVLSWRFTCIEARSTVKLILKGLLWLKDRL
jgi:hypothetical protein